MEMAGTMSVPRSMQRMRRVESGSGMPMQMYERKGAIFNRLFGGEAGCTGGKGVCVCGG